MVQLRHLTHYYATGLLLSRTNECMTLHFLNNKLFKLGETHPKEVAEDEQGVLNASVSSHVLSAVLLFCQTLGGL